MSHLKSKTKKSDPWAAIGSRELMSRIYVNLPRNFLKKRDFYHLRFLVLGRDPLAGRVFFIEYPVL